MAEQEKTGFEKFVFPIILVIITVLVTLFVEKYFFSESPELSYYITQSSPIDIGIKKYYSTTFNVLNTGNVPLRNVVLNASFDDTIATVKIEPPLAKNGHVISTVLPEPDSSTLKITFDLAKGEQSAITVVTAGLFNSDAFVLKSSEVLGKKMTIGKNQQIPTWIGFLLLLAIVLVLYQMFIIWAKTGRILELVKAKVTAPKESAPNTAAQKEHTKSETSNKRERNLSQ